MVPKMLIALSYITNFWNDYNEKLLHLDLCITTSTHFAITRTLRFKLTKLTAVHSPHDAESRAADFIEGLSTSDHLPENNTPTEHITFLTVVTACNTHNRVNTQPKKKEH